MNIPTFLNPLPVSLGLSQIFLGVSVTFSQAVIWVLGSEEIQKAGHDANRYVPELHQFDRFIGGLTQGSDLSRLACLTDRLGLGPAASASDDVWPRFLLFPPTHTWGPGLSVRGMLSLGCRASARWARIRAPGPLPKPLISV